MNFWESPYCKLFAKYFGIFHKTGAIKTVFAPVKNRDEMRKCIVEVCTGILMCKFNKTSLCNKKNRKRLFSSAISTQTLLQLIHLCVIHKCCLTTEFHTESTHYISFPLAFHTLRSPGHVHIYFHIQTAWCSYNRVNITLSITPRINTDTNP